MTKPTLVDVSKLIVNQSNPRYIKSDKFAKLVQSIREFPDMLNARPLIINQENEILGGNMRYKAAVQIGLKKIPCIVVDWTPEQQREFLIKDNVSFGDWDWDVLANEWETELLVDWGIDLWKPEYHPNLDPSSDSKEITATDVDRAESKIGIEQNFAESLDVICPECGAEFEIKRQ